MVQYCQNCGKELEDDVEFCDDCGFQLNETQTDIVKNKKTLNNPEFITKLPLILSIIGMIIVIAESLGTSILMGFDNIMMAITSGIVGVLLGILLMEKLDEPLIAVIEFITTGALVFILIGRFGELSIVLFIITAILILYLKGHYTNNKKLCLIPVLTVVLIFVLLIAWGALYQINAENSIEVENLTSNIKNDGYGYFDGAVSGDIYVGTNFDFLEVTVDFYDNQDKIIYSTIGWNNLNPESGKTYSFEGQYFDQKQPLKAEVKVVDSTKSTTPLYAENITLKTTSGV